MGQYPTNSNSDGKDNSCKYAVVILCMETHVLRSVVNSQKINTPCQAHFQWADKSRHN